MTLAGTVRATPRERGTPYPGPRVLQAFCHSTQNGCTLVLPSPLLPHSIGLMHTPHPRRAFLKSASLGLPGLVLAAPSLLAIEPFKRQGPSRLQLSLAAYSFRQYFKGSADAEKTKPDAAQQLDLFQFIDFCANHGCQGTELTSYYFPKEVSRTFLLQLRRHAFLRGIAISGTAVGNTFTDAPGQKRDTQLALVKQWVDYAVIMGAPHIRVFAGNAPSGTPEDQARKHCIEALEECGDYAGKAGIFLGIENHGGIVAEPAGLLEIVKAVKSPWLGINLDTGNFHTNDPYADIQACAPYAVNVQVKADMSPRGQKAGPADLPRLIRILREANYQGFVALEYESAPSPWEAIPPLLKTLGALISST